MPGYVPIKTSHKCAKWSVKKTMSAVGSGVTGHSDCLQPNNVTGAHILRAMLGSAGYTGSTQTCKAMGFNTSMGNGYAAINLPVGVADAFNKPIGMGGGDMGGMPAGGGGGFGDGVDMDMF
eukprot:TRINITY_DN30403_c0_g1_i1.p2 TRINITY_DN30403_c0_g1~~TRINITY_DN30403_c0_g1_i1.p2  ORF type:complete len:142 (+),score=52.91 TRINITY_DN30403_c0_g1_i1:66-428(+)